METARVEHSMQSGSSPRNSEDGGSSTTSFTFVVNDPSQAATSIESAPNPDRFAHTRSKRKRTSPQDFAVLEQEYEKNPRPDRAARGAIASRVALNEKEVQIWFQNRRQMTRRKARTWQPNEISDIIRSSQHSSGSASPPPTQEMTTQEDPSSSQTSMADKVEERVGDKLGQGIFANASVSSFEDTSRVEGRVEVLDDQKDEAAALGVCEMSATKISEAHEATAAQTLPATVEVVRTETVSTRVDGQSGIPQKSDRSLKRSDSKMRLRMSLDGKAELIIDKNSPSPPSKTSRRESWPARGPLSRSQSALNPSIPSLDQSSSDAPSSSQPASQPWTRTRPVGTSRDARTWEFYCDPDARDALSIAAEHDRKGLAQGALGLLRSNSGSAKHKIHGSPLTPNARKQNTMPRKDTDGGLIKTAGKRKSLDELGNERPKLARTSSSVARLQTSGMMPPQGPKTAPMMAPKLLSKKSGHKKGLSVDIFEDPGDDSDKENWRPGTRVSGPTHPRHPHPGAPSRQILGTNLREISHEASIGALLSSKNLPNVRRKQKSGRSYHAGDDQENSVVASVDGDPSFMGEGAAVAQGEELDAVQNLLSLSKAGQW